MSGDTREYVVTVTTRDSEQALDPRISAVIKLNSDSEPFVVELTVRTSEQGESLPHAVRDIDFERLSKALLNMVTASARMTDTAPANPQNMSIRPLRGDTSQRPYRKMPAVAEVKAVFLNTGSVGKLAKHFDVPRYTAQAWVDRLRRTGELKSPVAS